MNAKQLRVFISGVLLQFERQFNPDDEQTKFRFSTSDSVDLLLLTAAQESHLGEFLYQTGGGPALGIFQIEPNTYRDLCQNYLRFQERISRALEQYKIFGVTDTQNLVGNLFYQVLVARLLYWRHKEPVPATLEGRALYYKVYYNTVKGKATVAEALANYRRYVEGK